MNNYYVQEAVAFNYGNNFIPVNNRFRKPIAKKDVSIFLLSDSFDNDLKMIKESPIQMEYSHIIIPYRIIDKLGIRPFKFIMGQNEYNQKIMKMNTLKLQPRLIPIRFPYPKNIDDNLYISMSEVVKHATPILRQLGAKYIKDNIFDVFNKIFGYFTFSKTKVLIIDVESYKIYKYASPRIFMTDLINALLTALLINPADKLKKIDFTIIFRLAKTDVRFELLKYNPKTDANRLRNLLKVIGSDDEADVPDDEVAASLDDIVAVDDDNENILDDNINTGDDDDKRFKLDIDDDTSGVDDERLVELQKSNQNIDQSINNSINALKAKFASNISDGTDKKPAAVDKSYDAKALSINASLLKRINPDTKNTVDNYQTIDNDLKADDNNPEDDEAIDDAAEELSSISKPKNEKSSLITTTSARELQLRSNFGQIKLDDSVVNRVVAAAINPIPPAVKPLHLSTTNPGILKGTSFPNFAKAYEDNLLDKDIVATFMNLSKLPNGFTVKDIKVTDISSINSLMNNWEVTLQGANTQGTNKINIRVPKVMNGRFFYNGNWYNIGKQDFPIPILKINKKLVILTSNYNKISVARYDTRSLVDISMFVKTINKATLSNGKNPYVEQGSSVMTNSRFVSTIEFDEYAKQWYSFINADANCEVYFNRQQCVERYTFVSVNNNEFCCGMLNKVPIIINTETSMTRQGTTLTDLMLNTLPSDLYSNYKSMKPGKMSMYAEITIGIKIPLGVACAAWEGLSSLIRKSRCKYQYVNPRSFTDTHYFIIPFKDKALAIENTISNQLIFNGFYRINTKAYSVAEFETTIMSSNSIYVDIFNQLFFKKYSQLTTFITYYNFFVDAMTKEVCEHFNIPGDIIGMLVYAAGLLADNSYSSESNSSLYRIRSSEIIPAIIHYKLAFAISRYNNTVGSKSRATKFVFNPNDVIKELIDVNTVKTLSALNPINELHTREVVSKKGYRGVNDDRAYSVDKRSFDDSSIGKMALSSSNDKNVGIVRQLVADPKLESLRGYTSPTVDDNYNDLQLASFSELLTPGTVSRDDAIRTAIATAQSSHLVSTAAAEPVIISNGVDEIVPSYLTDEFTVMAEDDGIVLDIKDGYMIIEYASKKKKAINIGDRYSANYSSGFYVDNRLTSNFEIGDSFKKNDILAYHNKFFTRDPNGVVRMNIGPIAKVAFAGLYSTYEDAGLLTTKMSKRLSTNITMCQQIKLNATDDIEKIVKVGDEIEVGDPLVTFGLGGTGDKAVDNFLRAFQSSNDDSNSMTDSIKRTIRAKDAGKVVDVRMYTIKSMDKLSPSLFNILDNHFKENIKKRKILDKYDKTNNVYKMETFFDLPTEPLKGQTIKGIRADILVEVKISHDDDASVGDKLVAYGASKQIVSEVVPEGLEPYTENRPNEEVSMFVAPSSVLKRMLPSLLINSSANKVSIVLKEQVGKIWNGK